MDDFYEMMNEVVGNINPVVGLWVAGSVAFLFVAFLTYDAFRRKRKKSRFRSRFGSSESHGNVVTNSYKNVRSLYRMLDDELSRRRRRIDRHRGRRR